MSSTLSKRRILGIALLAALPAVAFAGEDSREAARSSSVSLHMELITNPDSRTLRRARLSTSRYLAAQARRLSETGKAPSDEDHEQLDRTSGRIERKKQASGAKTHEVFQRPSALSTSPSSFAKKRKSVDREQNRQTTTQIRPRDAKIRAKRLKMILRGGTDDTEDDLESSLTRRLRRRNNARHTGQGGPPRAAGPRRGPGSAPGRRGH